MKIAIIGTGYVGLVTGVSLAILGHDVICVGRDKEKVQKINKGMAPFFEPGLDNLLQKVLSKKIFMATDNFKKALLDAEIIIIAVGTPTVKNKIDLSAIKEVSKQIGKALKSIKRYLIVTVKSTVVPGTTENVVLPLLEQYSSKKAGKDFGLCMNPEFLREGNALEDALKPDRIVIGQFDKKSGEVFAKTYKKTSPIIFTNLKTAELIKYASNALFATLISYSNEIARIAEEIGEVDMLDAWNGVHLDRRLSPIIEKTRIKPGFLSYILSGCGYGGSCFPKDTKALANFAKSLGMETKLIDSVIEINGKQPARMIFLLKKVMKNLKNKKIAVLGLSFKPNTDDLRESAAIPIIEALFSEGAKVICHDPWAYKNTIPEVLKNCELARSIEEALTDADAALLITAWKEYLDIPPQFFKKNMKTPVIIDGRRVFDKNKFRRAGIIYMGIGLSY